MLLLNIGPVSNNRFPLRDDSSFLERSNNLSYSFTKKGLATNGYSVSKINFCPNGFATKYFLSIKSNLKISSNVYVVLSVKPKSICFPTASYRLRIN